nr:hypothetical protein [Tanacetum cinerariifolium]
MCNVLRTVNLSNVARGLDNNGGGDDRRPPHQARAPKTQFGLQESEQAAYPLEDPKPRVKEYHGCTWPRPDSV